MGIPNSGHIWFGDYLTELGAIFDCSAIVQRTLDEFLMLGSGIRRIRAWDFAATEGGGDWTVGVKLAAIDGNFFIEDVVRGQWNPGGVQSVFEETLKKDGPHVHVVGEQEPGSAGVTSANVYARLAAKHGSSFAAIRSTGPKVERARPFAAAMSNGLISSSKNAAWYPLFINEYVAFSADHSQIQTRRPS